MGLVVLGVAAGTPLAIAAVLLHILGHGLGKAVLFCGSGQILAAEGTTRIAGVRGLVARRPVLAGTFALGLAALLGLPPFSLFVSELALARAATTAGLGWAVAMALVLLLVVFVAVAARTADMLFGGDDGADVNGHGPPPPARSGAAAAPLVTGLVALAVLGVLGWPLEQLLRAAIPAAVGVGHRMHHLDRTRAPARHSPGLTRRDRSPTKGGGTPTFANKISTRSLHSSDTVDPTIVNSVERSLAVAADRRTPLI